jgi:RHS repeat-associated protein
VSSLGSNVLQSYVYDPMRRLSDVQTAGSSSPLDTHYTYDALGRVTTEAEKQPTFSRSTNLTYLGISNQISQEGQTTTIGTASPTTSSTTFGYDAYGIRTEMTNTGGVRPGTYGYGYDARGDVSMLIGQSGTDGNTAVATYGYDPYGVPDTKLTQGDTGAITPTNPSGATINPFGFEGRFTDPGSNTVDMGARRWGPQTMHFLEEDQFAGSLDDLSLSTDPLNDNRYDLAGGNPINFVETDGHRVAPTSAACVRTGQIYCTLSAFRRSSWSDRLSWLLKIGNKYAGQWLNAFDGIVTYFKESKVLSNSSRVKAADADVLWVIGRGLRADVGGNTFKVKPWTPVPLGYVLTHGVPRGAQTAVDDWASFFLGLGTPGIKDSQLKKLWGRAEFAGVHFAEHDTRNMPIGKFQYSVYQGFIKIGDVYRLALEKGTELKYHFSICGIIPYTVTRNPDPRYDAQWLAEKAMEYELYRRAPCG